MDSAKYIYTLCPGLYAMFIFYFFKYLWYDKED